MIMWGPFSSDRSRRRIMGIKKEKPVATERTKTKAKLTRKGSRFQSWIARREKNQSVLLTAEVEAKEPRAERPRSLLAEDMDRNQRTLIRQSESHILGQLLEGETERKSEQKVRAGHSIFMRPVQPTRTSPDLAPQQYGGTFSRN